tara:strand:- start:1738 stop:2973 length:1236 start_codon:yes stop_codon:yes gene_type:complete
MANKPGINNLFNIFEGMNAFGAGPGARTRSLLDTIDPVTGKPLITQDAIEKANRQSIGTGIVTGLASYLAQPKNKGYGSAVPYLAQSYLQANKAAQAPFQGVADKYLMDTQIAEQQRVLGERTKTQGVIDRMILQDPSLAYLRFAPLSQQTTAINENLKEKFKIQKPDYKGQAVEALTLKYINEGLKPGPARNKAVLEIEMKPDTVFDMSGNAQQKIQGKAIDYFAGVQENINAGISNATELAYAASLVEEAGSSQGFGAESLAGIDALAKRFNIDLPGSEQKHYIRALKTAQIKLALGEKKPGTGPMTDKDFENFLATTVQTTNPKATNQIIAFVAQAKQEMQKEFGDAFAEEVAKNGYGTNVYTFERNYFQDRQKEYIDNIKSNIKIIIDQNTTPGADSGVINILDTKL